MLSRGILTIESSRFDPQSFGDSYVILRGGNMRLRLVRDRGEVFAQVASVGEPAHWYPLQRVVCAVGVSPAPPEQPLSVEELAGLVSTHAAAIEAGLSPDRFEATRAKLRELGQDSARRLRDA